MAVGSDREPQDLEFVEEYRGQGILERQQTQLELHAFHLVRSKYDSASGWRFEGFPVAADWNQETRDRINYLVLSGREPLSFRGATHGGRSIQIPELVPIGVDESGRIRAHLTGFDIDTGDLGESPTSQSVEVWLSHTMRASPQNTLWVASWAEPKHDLLHASFERLKVRLGKVDYELHAGNEIEQVTVRGIEAQVHIPQCVLLRDRLAVDVAQRPTEMLDALSTGLVDFCTVMSLLCRASVTWSTMVVHSTREVPGERGWMVTSKRFARPGETGPSELETLMVRPSLLRRDCLGSLAANLSGSPFATTLRTSIAFLVEARRGRLLLYSLLNAWTGLETLVNGIGTAEGTDKVLDDEVFSKLCASLRRTVKEFSRTTGLGTDKSNDEAERAKRANLYEKFSELQRPAFVPRVCTLLERYGLDVEHLWQRSWPAKRLPLEKRLAAAYARRSAIIHRGEIADTYLARGDYLRIHALTELLIYRMLGGDDAWLNPSGWDDLYRHDLFKP